MYYLKTYPTFHHFRVLLNEHSTGSLKKKIKKAASILAPKLADVIDQKWEKRLEAENEAMEIFGENCFGVVDTFPIVCRRYFLSNFPFIFEINFKKFILNLSKLKYMNK